MEDLVDPISDIAEDDVEGPLSVTDYVQDIYTMYREREVRFSILDSLNSN